MRLYVESNFLLEIVLDQEQSEYCRDILDASLRGTIELGIPAFSVLESYHALDGKHKSRAKVHGDLQIELRQLGRARSYQNQTEALRDVSQILLSTAEAERIRIEAVRLRIEEHVNVFPLTDVVLAKAGYYQHLYALSARDATVLASVVLDLESSGGNESVFVTRNSKDFGDPDISALLGERGCRLMFGFDDTVSLLRSRGLV